MLISSLLAKNTEEFCLSLCTEYSQWCFRGGNSIRLKRFADWNCSVSHEFIFVIILSSQPEMEPFAQGIWTWASEWGTGQTGIIWLLPKQSMREINLGVFSLLFSIWNKVKSIFSLFLLHSPYLLPSLGSNEDHKDNIYKIKLKSSGSYR